MSHVRYDISSNFLMGDGCDDPADFTFVGKGTLLDEGRRIGHLTFTTFDYGMSVNCESNVSLYDLLDEHSSESAQYLSLFRRDGQLRSSVLRALGREGDEPLVYKVLSLDRLYIKPKYRKQGLAEGLIRRTIEQFGDDTTLVVFIPHPLLDHQKEFECSIEVGRKKLIAHYQKMGFKLVPSMSIMVHCMDRKLKKQD